MNNKIFLKERLFLFKNLDDSVVDKILSNGSFDEKHYDTGDIIQDCTCCDSIGILLKGKAIIRSGSDGVIIKKLAKGDVYGAAALFDKPTHSTIVVADSECCVITMDKAFILKCITNHQIAVNYIEFLSKKISFLNKKINTCTAKNAEKKLYNFLLQLPRLGDKAELNADMSTIAKMLGIGRATLYRAFEKLEYDGVIAKSDKIITFKERLDL